MTKTLAIQMLISNRVRFVVTVAVIALLFFLSTSQVGILVGWCNTISALIRNADVDVWVMAKNTSTFDYGTPIPESRLWQVRNVPGVVWAEAMYVGWNIWKAPNGQRTNIEIVGLDESCVGGPWRMDSGRLQDLHRPDSVIIDKLFCEKLGVTSIGDDFDLLGKRAIVSAISTDVRSFTTSPHVFTTIENARRYDPLYRNNEITYVLARCKPGTTAVQLRNAIASSVPHVEVLTSREFALRSIKYWMFGTGVGVTILLTAVLCFAVAAVVISQSLYALAQDHREHFATMLAIGFDPTGLVKVVFIQAMVLGGLGATFGGFLFAYAQLISQQTSIPLEYNAISVVGLVSAVISQSIAGSLLGARSVARVDPFTVFRG